MSFQAFLTDLNGVVLKSFTNWDELTITRRLGSYSEARVVFDPRDDVATVTTIGGALKIYDSGVLVFFGQVWEPVEWASDSFTISARDPYAGLAWRRVQEAVTYTDEDAGDIALARVTAQNARYETFLAIDAAPDVSVARTVTYPAGKREDEIIDELSAMSGGFFFRVDPLDDTPGKMGTLLILYPDAGTTRPEVRFGYGENTAANLDDFRATRTLPLSRLTVASQSPDGGRIAAAAQNPLSILAYGLFEDETTASDIDETTLLQALANTGLRPIPPISVELTPGLNAPLLFTDFDVGDFVRLQLDTRLSSEGLRGHPGFNDWVRVEEATVSVDEGGLATLASIVVAPLRGVAQVKTDPSDLFRVALDIQRARLEALERRVQEITTIEAEPPAPPVEEEPDPVEPGDPGGDPPPEEDPGPPPPEAPASQVPTITTFECFGLNFMDGGVNRRGIRVELASNGHGLGVQHTVSIHNMPSTLRSFWGNGSTFIDLPAGTYRVNVSAQSSGGRVDEFQENITVPNVISG